jgi:2'-5' RNA ligase
MTAGAERLRLFIAIELGERALQALGTLQTQLRQNGLAAPDLRWARPEGVHLTLKFLGEVDARRVPDIEGGLAEAARGVSAHRLSLGRLGTFGGKGAPRVLWVDVQGDLETLGALQQRVEDQINPLGFPREDRPFSPHLTLARVRPESARSVAEPLAQAIARVPVPEAEIEAREVSLMCSRLGPRGAVYTRLATFPLE